MIERVSFRNFKALADATIGLGRFTVFVGPNASGKTSILQGLHCLSRLGATKASKVFVGGFAVPVVRTRNAQGPMTLQMQGRWRGVGGSIELTTENPVLGRQDERGLFVQGTWEGEVFPFYLDDAKESKQQLFAKLSERARSLAQSIRSAALLRFEFDRLAKASWADSSSPRVEYDGYRLASVLASTTLTRPDDAEALKRAIRTVIPGFRTWKIMPADIRESQYEPVMLESSSVPHNASDNQPPTYSRTDYTRQGHKLTADFDGAPDIPAHSLSEGTLLVIGLLTVMIAPSRPRLLLIDNIERGLHPKAMGEFVVQIRKMLDLYEDLQIVATTHSPYFLDRFEPEEIRLTMVDPEKGVSCAPMTEHPEFDKWKDQMAPGEFWSLVGEDWVNTHNAKAK